MRRARYATKLHETDQRPQIVAVQRGHEVIAWARSIPASLDSGEVDGVVRADATDTPCSTVGVGLYIILTKLSLSRRSSA